MPLHPDIVHDHQVTGKRPFPGGTLQEIIFERLHTGTPPSLHSINPSLSADYDKVISQALARNPANRYTTAGEMAGEIVSSMMCCGNSKTAVLILPSPSCAAGFGM